MPLNIRDLACECGVSQRDLLALSPDNDPFAMHRPARLQKAEWFAELWQTFGFGFGVHVRRVHYRLVSAAAPVLLPDGEPYLNTERCWKLLVNAARDARYLDLVPAGSFVDRRNPEPISFFTTMYPGDLGFSAGGPYVHLPADFPSLPEVHLDGERYGAAVLVEVWAEKTTMNDVLMPLARRYGCNLVTGAGEMSLTSVRLFLDRVRRAYVPARILYISDFDPGGRSMPVAVARKIEFALDGATNLDIKLDAIALLPSQCAEFRLPRTPIKETERRGALFESRFGEGAVELDALEAVHPGELAKIVRREISRYVDPDAKREFDIAAGEHRDYLRRVSEQVTDYHAPAIDALREEYESIVAQLDAWTAKARPVFERIAESFNAYEFDEFEPPESPEPDDPPNPLFDSSRGYLEQLDAYKAWQAGVGFSEAAE